ncbi:MAG: hypothetical protein ACOC8F_05175 [Planctomycetota bacterium]
MDAPRTSRIQVDTYTRVCLTVIAVLLTVLIVGLWADGTPDARPARAAESFANATEQRKAIIDAQEATTAKLGELIALLRSGKVEVRLADAPDKAPKEGGGPDAKPEPE